MPTTILKFQSVTLGFLTSNFTFSIYIIIIRYGPVLTQTERFCPQIMIHEINVNLVEVALTCSIFLQYKMPKISAGLTVVKRLSWVNFVPLVQ